MASLLFHAEPGVVSTHTLRHTVQTCSCFSHRSHIYSTLRETRQCNSISRGQ